MEEEEEEEEEELTPLSEIFNTAGYFRRWSEKHTTRMYTHSPSPPPAHSPSEHALSPVTSIATLGSMSDLLVSFSSRSTSTPAFTALAKSSEPNTNPHPLPSVLLELTKDSAFHPSWTLLQAFSALTSWRLCGRGLIWGKFSFSFSLLVARFRCSLLVFVLGLLARRLDCVMGGVWALGKR